MRFFDTPRDEPENLHNSILQELATGANRILMPTRCRCFPISSLPCLNVCICVSRRYGCDKEEAEEEEAEEWEEDDQEGRRIFFFAVAKRNGYSSADTNSYWNS